jgi:predicted PurR-regulated permease PerM
MAAWGFTGMFKGAIVMSLFYTLLQSWVHFNKTHELEKEAAPVTNLAESAPDTT